MTIRRVRPGALAYPPYFPSGEGLLARHFNSGSSEYLGSSVTPVTAAPFTLAVWHLPESTGVIQVPFSLGDLSADDQTWQIQQLHFGAFQYRFVAQQGGAVGNAASSQGATVNEWVHLVAVERANNDRSIIVDGIFKNSNATAVTPANVDGISIGIFTGFSKKWYVNGRSFLPSIWNVALTDGEAFRLSRGAYPWEVRRKNLVGLWLAGPRSDRDFSGRGYHMTAFNTPTWRLKPPKVPILLWNTPRGFVAAPAERIPRNPAIQYQIPAIV